MRDLLYTAKVFRQIGIISVNWPHRLVGALGQLRKWGTGFPAAMHANARRSGNQLAIIDDEGELTWSELAQQVNQFTAVLKQRGIGTEDSVALLARNHRYMVIAMIAVIQVGGRILLLNTMATKDQVAELVRRENASLVLLDEEFLQVAADVPADLLMLSWVDSDKPEHPTIASELMQQPTDEHDPPTRHGSVVIFTSGTTGLPKGAKREEPKDLGPIVSFYGAIPITRNSPMVLASPLFHSWGLLNFGFGLSTTPTYILRRKFNPEQVLDDIEKYRAESLIVVPLMMQRMVALDPEIVQAKDVSSLKVTAASGSALAGDLAIEYMDTFTDSVYNFYGATETGWVTIAGPEDLRAAPGTAGRPPFRTTVKVLDSISGDELDQGETGVIYVKNDMAFGGYTDGNTKDFRDDLMNTGDLGHFDEDGRLFVSGRDDDMVISGGENVFPRELEDVLIQHPDVTDVVVTGVDDPDWGQRLAAYVVTGDGADLGEDDIVAYAKERLARFAVPGRVKFLDELPRNPTGKVMKRKLPQL